MYTHHLSTILCSLGIISLQPLMSMENAKLYNPTLASRQTNSVTAEATGQFLYWKTQESSTDFLRTGVGISNTVGTSEIPVTKPGTRYIAQYGFEPAFRVGLSFYFGTNTAFDFTTLYTRYKTTGTNSATRAKDLVAAMNAANWLVEVGQAADTINASSIQSNLLYNWIDFQAGYAVDIQRHFYLHPTAGITTFFNSGHLFVKYNYINNGAGPLQGHHLIHRHFARTSLWALGPKVGLDFSWNFTRNWSLFGSFDFKLLFAHQKSKATQKHHDLTNGARFDILKGKGSDNTTPFIWDFFLGPKWECWFSNNNYHLSLLAGWEWIEGTSLMGFLDQNNNFVGIATEIQGLTVASTFEF